jgi:hypothetical protein
LTCEPLLRPEMIQFMNSLLTGATG